MVVHGKITKVYGGAFRQTFPLYAGIFSVFGVPLSDTPLYAGFQVKRRKLAWMVHSNIIFMLIYDMQFNKQVSCFFSNVGPVGAAPNNRLLAMKNAFKVKDTSMFKKFTLISNSAHFPFSSHSRQLSNHLSWSRLSFKIKWDLPYNVCSSYGLIQTWHLSCLKFCLPTKILPDF